MKKQSKPINLFKIDHVFVEKYFKKIIYFLLIILLSTTIWARALYFEFFGETRGIYSFILILINLIWLCFLFYIYFEKREVIINFKKLCISFIIFLAIFSLNYSVYNEFSIIKFLSYLFISTLIFNIEKTKLKEIIFYGGLFSALTYIIVYVKNYILLEGNIFHPYHARLNFIGPNAIASGLLFTIIFLTAKEYPIKNIKNKFFLLAILFFLIINLIQTQSRTYGIIAAVNIVVIFLFKRKENIELFSSLPISFIYLYFFSKFTNLTKKTGSTNNSLTLFGERLMDFKEDGFGGRLQIWQNCYDSLPISILNQIFKKRSENPECSTSSSHNILLDIFTVASPLFIKLYYLSSIYGMFIYCFIKSIYQKNILALNLTIITSLSSLFSNSYKEPMNLLLIPIIFQLINGSNKFFLKIKKYPISI